MGQATEKSSVDGAGALARLMEGNKRYLEGQQEHRGQDERRRAEVASGQAPFAVILGCADSRVAMRQLLDRYLPLA